MLDRQIQEGMKKTKSKSGYLFLGRRLLQISLVAGFFGIKTIDAAVPPAVVSVSKRVLYLGARGGAGDTVTIRVIGRWHLRVVPASRNWLRVDRMSGEGTGVVRITSTLDNNDKQDRMVVVLVILEHATKRAVTRIEVVQRKFEYDLVWRAIMGAKGDTYINSIVSAPDGGCVVAGKFKERDTRGYGNMFVTKLDGLGNRCWERSVELGVDGNATAVILCPDQGYLVTGYRKVRAGGSPSTQIDRCRVVLIKLDSLGEVIWQREPIGDMACCASCVRATPDGGYILAGYHREGSGDRSAHGNDDMLIVKVDGEGKRLWSREMGGSDRDYAACIAVTPDGNYVVAGTTASMDGDVRHNHGGNDGWLAKLDKNGRLLWQRAVGGSRDDFAYGVCPTADGGCVMTGISWSSNGHFIKNHGGSDAWAARFDKDGRKKWLTVFGGTGDDYAGAIEAAGDGGYLIAGYSGSEVGGRRGRGRDHSIWMVRINENGVITWMHRVDGEGVNEGYCLATEPGGFFVGGAAIDWDAETGKVKSKAIVCKMEDN